MLVTALIFLVSTKTNVYAADSISVVRVTGTSAELAERKDITYRQEGSFDIGQLAPREKEIVILMDSSASMNTVIEETESVFDYALFSGDEANDMVLHGASLNIDGNVHSNRGVIQRAKSIDLNGSVKAVTQVTLQARACQFGSNTTVINNASPIEMPNLSIKFMQEAYMANQLFTDATVNEVLNPDGSFKDPLQDMVNCYHHSSTSWNINGTKLKLNGSAMYFEGDVVVSVNSMEGSGIIVATGNIMINGDTLSSDSLNPIGFYSVGGNIMFNNRTVNIHGLVYAPNGNISFNSDTQTVNGSVVGKSLTSGNNTVTYNHIKTSIHERAYSYEYHPSTFDMAKSAAKEFIDKFAGKNAKISVVRFSSDADSNDFLFYDMSLPGQVIDIKRTIDTFTASGSCNLGDGLRRAYHMLKNSSPYTNKYIVVLTSFEPNRWTKDDIDPTEFKTSDGEAVNLGGNGLSDVDGRAKGYGYVIGDMISESSIEPFFIDFKTGGVLGNIEQTAVSAGAAEVDPTGKHYYDAEPANTAVTSNILNKIFDKINSGAISDYELEEVEFVETLPEGVQVLSVPDGFTYDMNPATGRFTVTGKIKGAKISKIDGYYALDVPDFNISVRYTKPRQIEFKGSDGSITYTFNYVDIDGNPVPPRTVNLSNFVVNVKLTIDIG